MAKGRIGNFSNRILDHFYNPRNVGIAEGFNRSFLEQNNPWLIRIRFTLRVSGDRIDDVRFQAQSCVTTTACCSALTEMVRGQAVEHARSITPEQLSEYLGTIPQEKMYCAAISINALRRALEQPSPRASTQHPQEGANS